MGKSRKMLLSAASALAIVMMAPGVAFAQSQSEEIIVTATKREQSLQEVPFSVNAQTQEDIQRSGAGNLEDLSRNVAGMAIQNLGPGQSQVALRGVSAGQIVRDQPGVKEQVGVYLDESVISLSLFTPDLDLFDLNRVETLRGPQGTLFGSGSVGGTIRYITNQPTLGEFSGSIEGNVNIVEEDDMGGHLKGMVNIPVTDQAALRVVGYYQEYAGFIDAIGPAAGDNVNDGERMGLRAAFRVEATPSLTITPRLIYQRVEVNGFNREEAFNVFANPFMAPPITLGDNQQFLRLREEFKDETVIGDLVIEYDMGDMALTSVSSYTSRNILVGRDASALTGSVSIDLGYPTAGIELPSNLRDNTDLNQFTQEIRLTSTNDSPFQWLIGAFYSDVQRDYSQRLPTPGYDFYTDLTLGAGTSAAVANGFGPDSPYNADLPYDYQQVAIFGEASYDITERLTVTAGARWYDFEEERRFTSGGLFSNGDDEFDSTASDGISPRVLMRYEASDALSFNAQVSKGFRLGGANDPLNIPLCSGADAINFGGFPTYEDENLWNYEVGGKFDNGTVSFNAAIYHTDIEDLQVTADAGSCSSRVVFNADAHTTGLEAELSARPVQGLELSLAASWVEAEFDETRLAAGGGVLEGIREGNRLPSVPEYQLAATAAYYIPINFMGPSSEWFAAASVQHVGSRYTQPGDQESNPRTFVSNLAYGGATGAGATTLNLELDPYTIVNFNTGIESDDWALIFYVNNITDEQTHLSFDRERGGRARLAHHVNQPRTIGFTVRRNF